MAERQGFEPWEPRGSTVFKTVAFDHSATSPDTPSARSLGVRSRKMRYSFHCRRDSTDEMGILLVRILDFAEKSGIF